MIDSLCADIQREARAKIEAAHTWGRVQVGTRYYLTTRVCTSCGHSDLFAIAHGLTTCCLTLSCSPQSGRGSL